MTSDGRAASARPRVVLAHDYLTEAGGAERVVAALAGLFPSSPIVTSAVRREALEPSLAQAEIRATFLQRVGASKRRQQALFPVLPLAFRTEKVPACDVLLTSTSGFAHHLRPPRGALHVAYCHTPPRFLWDPDAYFLGRDGLRNALWPWLAGLRSLDRAAARRVDVWIANSRHTAARIRAVYGRDATVIHPPVPVERFRPTPDRSGRFLVVSRLLPYKRIDRAIDAANLDGSPLDVVGDGPDRACLARLAGGNVRLLGRLPDDAVRELMARCTALIVPGIEDFGLTMVEAQASGRPPIALAAGGALETVTDGVSGFLVVEPTPEAFAAAMRRAASTKLPATDLVAAAARFDTARFEAALGSVLESALQGRRAASSVPEPA